MNTEDEKKERPDARAVSDSGRRRGRHAGLRDLSVGKSGSVTGRAANSLLRRRSRMVFTMALRWLAARLRTCSA